MSRAVRGWYFRKLRRGFNKWKSMWRVVSARELRFFETELESMRAQLAQQQQQLELQAEVELKRQQLEAEHNMLREQSELQVERLEAEKQTLVAELQTLYTQVEDQYQTFDMAKQELDNAVNKSKDQFLSTAKQLSEQQLKSAQSQALAVSAESRLTKAHSTIGRLQREVVLARGELMKIEEDNAERTEHLDTEYLTEAQRQLVSAQQHLSDSILLDNTEGYSDDEDFAHSQTESTAYSQAGSSPYLRGGSNRSSLRGEDVAPLELRHLDMYDTPMYSRSAQSSPMRQSTRDATPMYSRSVHSSPMHRSTRDATRGGHYSPSRRLSKDHSQIEDVQAQIMHAQNQLTTATMVLQGRGDEGEFNDAISATASTTSSFAESSLRKLGLHR
jgi:hypothetical protein